MFFLSNLLKKFETKYFFFSSLLDNQADKSSDEKQNKDRKSNLDSKSSSSTKNEQQLSKSDEGASSNHLNNKNISPIRYRRAHSSTTDCSPTRTTNRNKKSTTWFNFLPSYKVRAEEFKKHFGHIVPSNERFIVDYSCAYQREILAQGRMYISLNYICFYANIFSWETNLVVRFRDIKQINKTNTALIIPNAIEILTNSGDKYFFASYVSREKAFLMLYKIWQNALLDIKLDARDIIETGNKLAISEDLIWDWIHEAYGNYLGYTEEEEKHQKSIKSTPAKDKNKKLINDSDSSSDSDLFFDSDTFNDMKDPTVKQIIDSKLMKDKNDNLSFNCLCEEHDGNEVFRETFPLTVDQMFTLAFDDSPFFRMIQKLRKSTVLSSKSWQDVDDSKIDDSTRERNFNKTRELKMKLQLENPLAKTVDVCEVQFLDERSLPGYYYMIYSRCQNSGVPFADTFQVHTQFCFSRGASVKECKLTAYVKVEFIKSVFGLSLMKSTIENSSMKGVSDYWKFLSKHLNNWCKEKSLERRQNLNFQQFKQLEYDSSNEDNQEDDDDDNNFVLSNDNLLGDETPLIKTNSINRKVFGSKRFKSSSISTLNSARQSIKHTPQSSPFWKFQNNELILLIILIILLSILILILFLFKRLWQLEVLLYKYEEDLINFERFIKFTSNLSNEENLRKFLFQSNSTVLSLVAETWKDLINQTENTIQSMKSIYLEKSSLDKPFDGS